MTPAHLVDVDARARRAFVALPVRTRPGTIWQLEDGSLVRIREDGGADELLRSGYPRRGIGADPVPTRGVA